MKSRLGLSGVSTLLLCVTLLVAGCESSEERAQEHFESGMELLEQGDTARAFVEFRNVFKLNPRHKEARLIFARALTAQDKPSDAYVQYLRLVEHYPDNVEARLELSEMAILTQNWEEAERHGREVQKLAPDNERVKIIGIALDYAKSYRDDDLVAAAEQAELASKVLETSPDSAIARRVVIDQKLRIDDGDGALAEIDDAIAQDPDNIELSVTRLQLKMQQEDIDGVGETLKEMVERFPENQEIQKMLIAWFLDRQDVDSAEVYLRDLAEGPEATRADKINVVRFLMEVRSVEDAITELNKLVETKDDDTVAYRTLLASLEFDGGERDKAIADLEDIVAEGAATEDKLNAKAILARMLTQTGNVVGGRARVEEILVDDPTNVDALKMRSAWLIDEDKPDEAVIDLRTALSQSPRDPDILTLMGRAHERAGSRDLAGERYALAVEVSLQAPAESLRYAAFLVDDERVQAAKTVLVEALEKAPKNQALLRNMGLLNIQLEEWSEVTRTVWKLRALEDDGATAIANGLEADMLLRQQRVEETISLLEELVAQDGSNKDGVLAALVKTKVSAGQIEEATLLVDNRLAESPENAFQLRFMRAGLHMLSDERDEAEEIFADLLKEVPAHERSMRTLYSIMVADGRDADAVAMVDQQVEASNNAVSALLLKAEHLERAKEFEGAIEIYEGLYARNSNNIIVANNLASMITTHRDDPADLDRAYAIARRLSPYKIPALQDTYGWIAYRKGNYDEALQYLEPAAAGAPEHALIQYHAGMAYLAVNRNEDAKRVLQLALDLAGDDPLPEFQTAREKLEELQNQ